MEEKKKVNLPKKKVHAMVGSVNLRYCGTFFLFVYKDNLDTINS
jgi:hypothetical protein